jgi:putative ABC transport system permease protein
VLAPDRPPVTLVVREGAAAQVPPLGQTIQAPAGRVSIRVSEPAARLYHLAPGATLWLPLGGRRLPAFVTALYRDYARQEGAITIESAAYTALTHDPLRGEAAVHLAPGADPDAVMRALNQAMPPAVADMVQIVPTRLLKTRALAIFDRSFAITYGLEIIAVLVGLAGVAATTSAQTIAHARVQHAAPSGRDAGTGGGDAGDRGALLGLVGGVAGITLGCVLAQVLIHVVNPSPSTGRWRRACHGGFWAGWGCRWCWPPA